MLKRVSICAGLLAFVTTQVAAHQQEAELQRIPIPGAAFDLVIATPKYPVRPIFDLSESPDALIVHLIGGELLLAFDEAEKMPETAQVPGIADNCLPCHEQRNQVPHTVRCLRRPKSRIAYLQSERAISDVGDAVNNGVGMFKSLILCATLVAVGTSSVRAQERENQPQNVTISKLEVRGADFDIVFVTSEVRPDTPDDRDVLAEGSSYAGLKTRIYLIPKGENVAPPQK